MINVNFIFCILHTFAVYTKWNIFFRHLPENNNSSVFFSGKYYMEKWIGKNYILWGWSHRLSIAFSATVAKDLEGENETADSSAGNRRLKGTEYN